MQINKKYQTEIDFRDLFFHLCYRWRSIAIAALVGALLLGAYQYLSIQKIHSEGKQTREEKQYEIDLQDYRDAVKNARKNISTYTKQIKEKDDYLDESIYMTLDSQNEWVAYKTYFIAMDQSVLDALPESLQTDPADYVAAVYTSTLKSGLDAGEMEALLGTGKKDYIDELVSIDADNDVNTITVQVIGAEEATVTEQLDYFVNRLFDVSQPQAQVVGAHTLALVNEEVFSRTDSDLSAEQSSINQDISSLQEDLSDEKAALNALEEKKEPKAPGKHLGMFAAIGFILGAILLVGFYAVRYVLDGKLHSARELSERYSLPVYGEFAKSRARHPGKGLDKLFERWEFKHAVTDAGVTESGVCTLLSECLAGKKLLLTGTVSDQRLDALASGLRQRLNGACDIASKGGLPVNSEAIAMARNVDAVILVEDKYHSRNGDIRRAVELLDIGEANVAGCVLL